MASPAAPGVYELGAVEMEYHGKVLAGAALCGCMLFEGSLGFARSGCLHAAHGRA